MWASIWAHTLWYLKAKVDEKVSIAVRFLKDDALEWWISKNELELEWMANLTWGWLLGGVHQEVHAKGQKLGTHFGFMAPEKKTTQYGKDKMFLSGTNVCVVDWMFEGGFIVLSQIILLSWTKFKTIGLWPKVVPLSQMPSLKYLEAQIHGRNVWFNKGQRTPSWAKAYNGVGAYQRIVQASPLMCN